MSGDIRWHPGQVPHAGRSGLRTSGGATVWLTGLSGSGKSTIAHGVEAALVERGVAAYALDGDNLRHGLNADLGFDPADRDENVRRVGEVARLMADAGIVALAPVISPRAAARRAVAELHRAAGLPFLLVHVATPLAVCEVRDTKGLYARARDGSVPDFTGISAPYEPPDEADLVLDTSAMSEADAVAAVVAIIEAAGI